MTRTPDTSVVVAGLCAWHPDHEVALPELAGRPIVVAHVLVESYSVLTRLPHNQRVKPELAAAALAAAFAERAVAMTGPEVQTLIDLLARSGVHGGAAYDAVIAATARRHELTLVTLDARAATTYDVIGVETEFLGR